VDGEQLGPREPKGISRRKIAGIFDVSKKNKARRKFKGNNILKGFEENIKKIPASKFIFARMLVESKKRGYTGPIANLYRYLKKSNRLGERRILVICGCSNFAVRRVHSRSGTRWKSDGHCVKK
jgi:hypothetical protein